MYCGGGDFVAPFLVYGQYFYYGNTVPHSGSNNRLQLIATLALLVIKEIFQGSNSIWDQSQRFNSGINARYLFPKDHFLELILDIIL